MSAREDDPFRPRPGAPKTKGSTGFSRFVSRVLREAGKAGGKPSRLNARNPSGLSAAKLGRGHVAARFAGRKLDAQSRRVVIKARYLVLRQAGTRSLTTHLRYIEREGVERDGSRGHAYSSIWDKVDLAAFEERSAGDRHQFRFIVSAEDAEQLQDLKSYTRHLMTRMEADLGSSLDWVAVDHWNTDHPHTHIVLRGKDAAGRDLIIARDYVSHGMRQRACELATEWLGPRSAREISEGLLLEVDQERWTSLDRALQDRTRDGVVDLAAVSPADGHSHGTLSSRLQRLSAMGLASKESAQRWRLRADIEPTLRAMGERGDILRTVQRTLAKVGRNLGDGIPASESSRELSIFSGSSGAPAVVGRIVGKGLADELKDTGYLVVDGIDGRAHYVALPAAADISAYPLGAIVDVRGPSGRRTVDMAIAGAVNNGMYRSGEILAALPARKDLRMEPEDVVAAHVRRLEVLRRAGIVERVADGVWRVPSDLIGRARALDAGRLASGIVTVQSSLPIERQVRVIGATWLDRQLIVQAAGVGEAGFGQEVRRALAGRAEFLEQNGLASRSAGRVVLVRDLLSTLRNRELEAASKSLSVETGLAYRAIEDGGRVLGTYRRSVDLASGRFALIDDGLTFSLVPWKPVIESRLGQTMAGTVRGGLASWEIGRGRGAGFSN